MTWGWLLHVLVVGSALTVAAAALEPILIRLRMPVRIPWTLAGAATVAWATVMLLWAPGLEDATVHPPSLTDLPSIGATGVADGSEQGALAPIRSADRLASAVAGSGALEAHVPGWMIGLWLLGSAAILVLATADSVRATGSARRWPLVLLGDRRFHAGPVSQASVVGLFRPRIVVPEELLERGDPDLEVVLEHEDQHRRAGDVRRIALGIFTVALLPWHPALWWHVHRLRLAVEIDCDRRTLDRLDPISLRAYGRILLDSAARAVRRSSTVGISVGVGVAGGSAWALERRVRALVTPPGRASSFLGVLLAVGAAVVACEAPSPTEPGLLAVDRPAALTGELATGAVALRFSKQVDAVASEVGPVGSVALAVRPGPNGHPEEIRFHGTVGDPDVRARAIRALGAATVSLSREDASGSDGWIPLWMTFRERAMRVALVDPEIYERQALLQVGGRDRIEAALERYAALPWSARASGPAFPEVRPRFALETRDPVASDSPVGSEVSATLWGNGGLFDSGEPVRAYVYRRSTP